MNQVGFIFDCDGVLLDSIGAWHRLDAQLAAEAGITLTGADRAVLNASTLDEAATYFHEHYAIGESSQEVSDRFTNILFSYYRDEASEVAGALAFVRAAREAGVRMCVLSSSPQLFLQAGLGHAGFLDMIDTVLSAEELPCKKRNPELYPYVCGLLGVSPAQTWFFDDSWYALEAAQKAGVRTVGVWSADQCGTHEELAAHSELVVDDFLGLRIADFV